MREILSKGELNAKCELALMGYTIQILDMDNLEYCVKYVCKVINGRDEKMPEICMEKLKRFLSYEEGNTSVNGFTVNTVLDMPVITFTIKDKRERFNILSEDGVLCYCFNCAEPAFSEGGYCFFEKSGNKIHRIS